VANLAAERHDALIITRGGPDAAARAVQRRCAAGELARLAPGIYVREHDPQAQAARVREHWVRILGELVPGSVVSYRSAYGAVPTEGVVVLSHPTRFNRTIRLPGLRVALVKGPGPLPGDTPLGEGTLHLASMERMLLENLTRTRGHEGRSRGDAAVQERLGQILAGDGVEALQRLRVRARELAGPLGMQRELARLEALLEALPKPAQCASSTFDARAEATAQEFAADADCIAMLETLATRLRARPVTGVAASPARQPDRTHQAFVEAWFDCFDSADLQHTASARAAVLGGKVGAGGSAPMRELLSVFKLAVSSPLCDSVPPFGSGFANGLKARHALMMRLAEPGEAGRLRVDGGSATVEAAVAPEHILGTLAAGSTRALAVPEGLARAIFYSVLLWRVQPFDRGNEPLARLVMNAELSSVGQGRIIIPARMRARVESAREQLVERRQAARYIRLLARLQRWTASLDFSDLDRVLPWLERMRAFDGARSPRVSSRL
jgi:hypothetical protein